MSPFFVRIFIMLIYMILLNLVVTLILSRLIDGLRRDLNELKEIELEEVVIEEDPLIVFATPFYEK